MRKVIRFSTYVLVLAAAAALAMPQSHATCANSTGIIGQPGETNIDMGLAAADATPTDGVSTIQASYWRFGAGNPAPALGADNGLWGNDAANGTGPWFFDATGTGGYITAGTTEHDGATDGCINGANDSGGDADDDLLLAACGPDGKFFVVAGQSDGSVFNFGVGPYTAANSPQIVVTNSVRIAPGVGTGVQIFFSTPSIGDFAANYFDNGAGVPIGSVFTGVNVYSACVPRGNGSPARFVPGVDWLLAAGSPFPLSAAGQSVTRDCGPGLWDVFVGTEPRFDGATPFTAGCVTGTTRPVQAGSTLANPSDDTPRTIKKPRGIRPTNPN